MKQKQLGIIQIKPITSQKCIVLFLMLVMWGLLGLNTKMIDQNNYKLFYSFAQNGIRYTGIEYGFYAFMRICSILKMNYQEFLMVYSLVGNILIGNSILNYSKYKTSWVILLFIFFPYLHVLSAVRNFMAFAFILWGIRYLFGNGKRSIIKYCICIVIASLFHISAIYAFIYLMCKLEYKKVMYIVFSFSIFGFIILLFGDKIIGILIGIIPKLQVYLSLGLEGTRGITKIFLAIYFWGKIILCYFIKKENDISYNYKLSVLCKINMLTIVAFPLCVFDMDFMRIEYDIIIVMSIFVYDSLYANKNLKKNKSNMQVIKVVYPIYYFISGYILLYLFSSESVVQTIWENNMFWRLF